MKKLSRRSCSLEERFWEKVDVRGIDECWLWKASTQKGYGQIGVKGRRAPDKAHRVSWILHYGGIPNGMSVLHKCDNPICVNPSHLFLGTQADNMRDMDEKGRRISTGAKNQRGEHNNAAKLNDALVRYIREQQKIGRSNQSIADEIGVSRRTVAFVVSGITWSHVR